VRAAERCTLPDGRGSFDETSEDTALQ